MKNHATFVPAFLLAGVLAVAGIGLGGCGENPTSGLWDAAIDIEEQASRQLQSALEHGDQGRAREAHHMKAQSLSGALEIYEGGDEDLRRVLSEIRDGERRLANGEVSGAAANELREQHEEYWSHLRQRQLPPELR